MGIVADVVLFLLDHQNFQAGELKNAVIILRSNTVLPYHSNWSLLVPAELLATSGVLYQVVWRSPISSTVVAVAGLSGFDEIAGC
jgi:hypothetical protein